MSRQVRSLVLKRHVATMLVYLICNLYAFTSFLLPIVPSWKITGDIYSGWLLSTMKILFAAQGWFIPLMRLSEPYFYQILVQQVKKWWKSNDKNQKAIQAKQDDRFARGAIKLNQEAKTSI